MAFTVTVNETAGQASGILLRIFVITGAAAVQNGGSHTQSGNAAHQTAVVTTVTNSRVYGAIINSSNTAGTPLANTTIVDEVTDATNVLMLTTWKATALTGSPGSTTLGESAPANIGGTAGYEVLPGAGLAEDGSAPAVVSTTAAHTVTTAAFSPPAGSLLVALVSANGGGAAQVTMSITDTSGFLTWTARAEARASGDKYAGVFTAPVPTTPLPALQQSVALVWQGLPQEQAPPSAPQPSPPLPAAEQAVTLVQQGLVTQPQNNSQAQITNGFESGTSGTSVSAVNSGGVAGSTPFNIVTIGSGATLAYDNTLAAHGNNSVKVATVASAGAMVEWSTSFPWGNQVWFRQYLYFPALPVNNHRTFEMANSSGAVCGVQVNTSGQLFFVDAAGATIFVFATIIPLNQWFRIEGFVVGSPAAGQASLQRYDSPDSTVATESHTSAANRNTSGAPSAIFMGVPVGNPVANVGPFWMDSVGLSNVGPLGPDLSPARTLGPAPAQNQTSFLSVSPVQEQAPPSAPVLTPALPASEQALNFLLAGLPGLPVALPGTGTPPPQQPLPAQQQALNLVQQGLPQSPQLPPAQVQPPVPAPQQSVQLVQQGLPLELPGTGALPPQQALPAPQQAVTLVRQGLPQSPQLPPPPVQAPVPAPEQAASLLQLGLPQSAQSPQVPPPPQPVPAPSQATTLLQQGLPAGLQFSQQPSPPAPIAQPQHALTLLQQGLPVQPQSPPQPVVVPPVVLIAGQSEQALNLLISGLPQSLPGPALATPPPPLPAAEQAVSFVQQGRPQSAESPQVQQPQPPGPAPEQSLTLLVRGLLQQPEYNAVPPPLPPPPPAQQSVFLLQRGLPTPGNFFQVPVVVIPPPPPAPAPEQSVTFLRLGLPTPGNFFQVPALPPPPPQPAQAQEQALTLLWHGLPQQQAFNAVPPAGHGYPYSGALAIARWSAFLTNARWNTASSQQVERYSAQGLNARWPMQLTGASAGIYQKSVYQATYPPTY